MHVSDAYLALQLGCVTGISNSPHSNLNSVFIRLHPSRLVLGCGRPVLLGAQVKSLEFILFSSKLFQKASASGHLHLLFSLSKMLSLQSSTKVRSLPSWESGLKIHIGKEAFLTT